MMNLMNYLILMKCFKKIVKDHLDINNGGKSNEHIKNKDKFLADYKGLYDKIIEYYPPIIEACTNKLCKDFIEKQKVRVVL